MNESKADHQRSRAGGESLVRLSFFEGKSRVFFFIFFSSSPAAPLLFSRNPPAVHEEGGGVWGGVALNGSRPSRSCVRTIRPPPAERDAGRRVRHSNSGGRASHMDRSACRISELQVAGGGFFLLFFFCSYASRLSTLD